MGKHRWKGELAKPIRPKVIRPRGLRVTTKAAAEKANKEMEDLYQQAIEAEYLRKLELLMDKYHITDKTDFRSLALVLATKELDIPGFRIDPTPLRSEEFDEGILLIVQDNRVGPRPKYSLKRLLKLLSVVEEIKKKHRISTDLDALRILVQRKEWSRPPKSRGGLDGWIKTLKNRLAEARRYPGSIPESESV
jgi:hypothetical protein